MIIPTVIVDDEAPICDEMEYLLRRHVDVKVVARFEQAAAALEYIAAHRPRLVFLDISMPGMSGLEMAARLGMLREPPLIVFTTAHPEHALAAFETPAVGYITKPVTAEKVAAALAKVRNLAAPAAPQVPASKLCVLQGGRIVPLERAEIVLVYVREKDVFVRTRQQEYSAIHNLQEIEGMLAEGGTGGRFLRVHRQFIVNLDRVTEVIPWFKGTFMLRMDDAKAQQVPVSRHRVREVKAALGLK